MADGNKNVGERIAGAVPEEAMNAAERTKGQLEELADLALHDVQAFRKLDSNPAVNDFMDRIIADEKRMQRLITGLSKIDLKSLDVEEASAVAQFEKLLMNRIQQREA